MYEAADRLPEKLRLVLLTIPVKIGVYVCRDAKTPGNKRDGVEMPSAPPQRRRDKFLSKIKPGAGKRGAAGTVIRRENRGNANLGAADVTGPGPTLPFPQ